MDVWVGTDRENAERVRTALARFGAPVGELSIEDLCQPGTVFQIGVAPNRIDVITQIDGVEFDDAWPRRVSARFADVPVWIISVEDLVRNKKASGRPQDLADVRALNLVRWPVR